MSILELTGAEVCKECGEKAQAERDRLLAENAKLQASNEVIAEDHAALCEQNAKLRGLVRDMFDGMCDHDRCNICPHWQKGYNGCEYHARMRGLGIEVDE